jgi:predicted dehydrogenase
MTSSKNQTKMNCRDFVRNSAISAAAITVIPRYVFGTKGFIPPSDKVNIGIVGAGGRSFEIMKELFPLNDVQLITVADPSEHCKKVIFYKTESGRRPAKAFIEKFYATKTPNHKVTDYEDFRVMLEKEKSLDAIVCASPDNTHAYISIMSMRAGKHVYCEKPLTHNIWEARKVAAVARETGLATQMGNQMHSSEGLRQTVEFLRSGIIGAVHEAHSWVPATRWLPALNGFPEGSTPVPEELNWDLWLGPTAWRPYHEAYTPVRWRDFWEFGCGALGDFGCHDMDTAVWAFNLKPPKTIEVYPAGNSGSNEIAPYGEIGYFHFKANGNQPALKLNWYSGGLRPARHELLPQNVALAPRGAMYVGEKGIILNSGGRNAPQVFPSGLMESFSLPPATVPAPVGHCREWINAIKGGPAASSDFEYGAKLTEITLLGVLSLRMGGAKIYWDNRNMKANGLEEADSIIREPVRPGWEME